MSSKTDGRDDFDFIHGRWRIHNRKLANLLDRACTDWLEFQATSEALPILGGLGNSDIYSAILPDGTPLDGFTLRLFNPQSAVWRIWSATTTRPGHMDPPVEGRFTDGCGRFFCDDVLSGHPVMVRFEWRDITTRSATWEQAFSYDGGQTWRANWSMSLTREGHVPSLTSLTKGDPSPTRSATAP